MGICITYNYNPKENNDIKVSKTETQKEELLKKKILFSKRENIYKIKINK